MVAIGIYRPRTRLGRALTTVVSIRTRACMTVYCYNDFTNFAPYLF